LSSNIEELTKRVEKAEDKVKLSNLLVGKRFADLEIKIAKMDEKFKEIITEFPKLKETTENVENLLNVINLGILDYRNKFKDIYTRLSGVEKVPNEIRGVLANYEMKLKNLSEDVKKLSARLVALKTLKEDVTKSVKDTIALEMNNISKAQEINKVELEHVKKDIDTFSTVVKSFERTMEATELDNVIRRFNSIDRRIVDTQSQIEELRRHLSGIPVTEKYVQNLNRRIDELGTTVMDRLSRLGEFERNVENFTKKLDDIERSMKNIKFTGSTNLSEDVKEQLLKLNETKTSLQELSKRVGTLSEKKLERPEGLEDMRDKIEELEKVLIAQNKNLSEYKKLMEKRLQSLGTKKPEKISNKVFDEITSLKNVMIRLSTNYEDLRKVMKDMKLLQMKSVTMDTLMGIMSRITALEEKIGEIEKGLTGKPSRS